jgi:hypothetical protein
MYARLTMNGSRWHKAYIFEPKRGEAWVILDCSSCLNIEDREVDVSDERPLSDLCKRCVLPIAAEVDAAGGGE